MKKTISTGAGGNKQKNLSEQPHAKQFPYHLSPRCGAKTRKGPPCLSPAVRDKKRCRMHGGAKKSGAPPANKNALKSGYYSRKSKLIRKGIKLSIKSSNDFLKHFH